MLSEKKLVGVEKLVRVGGNWDKDFVDDLLTRLVAEVRRLRAENDALREWEGTLRRYLGMSDGDRGPSVGSLPDRTLPEVLAENDALRRQVAGHAERIAAQSELPGRRAGKPLAWSEELPAVQGWYWWRADDESPPVVEWVYDDYRVGPRLVVWVEAGEAPTVREKGGEWAGPLSIP